MTPEELAAELNVSPKTIRAWLRRTFPRAPDEQGTAWKLTPDQEHAVRSHWSLINTKAPVRPRSRRTQVRAREESDEHYVIDLCDELLDEKAQRQASFPWLRGDSGRPLPVDAYYPAHSLVIEYRERQHAEPVAFFDRRDTVSGVGRGEQRRIYDKRREEEIPRNGLTLLIIRFDQLVHDSRGRLKRDQQTDRQSLEILLGPFMTNK